MTTFSQARPLIHADPTAASKAPEVRWVLFYRNFSTRRQLRQLDAEQLKDIGLTAEQARQEASVPFWR